MRGEAGMRMRRAALLAALLAAGSAAAFDDAIAFHGFVTPIKGEPLGGRTVSVTFRIYDGAGADANCLWARIIPVAVRADGGFYADLKDEAGSKASGAACERLQDAMDRATAKGASPWVGWSLPDAREVPRVELAKYPYAFMATKARKAGFGGGKSVVAKDVAVAAGKGQTNVFGTVHAGGVLLGPSGTLTMASSLDEVQSAAFTLTGGISGFRGVRESELAYPVKNDTLQVKSSRIGSEDQVSYSSFLLPCGSSNQGDGAVLFTQTLGKGK